MKYPIPPLTFFKNTSYKGPNIYDVGRERGWGSLEIRYMFTYSAVFKQQIYCSFLRMGVRGWGVGAGRWRVDVIIVWYLILKLALISFGASVIMKQSSSLLNICTFKMRSNLKHLQEWHQKMRNCKSLFKQIHITVEKNEKSAKNYHISLVVVL